MSADEYLTVAGPGHAQTRVLGSRFFGAARPVASWDEVTGALAGEQKRFHDATHWCWAARAGVGSALVEKSSDAGEPRGTAGLPILRELQRVEVTNAMVIVTRWFGGTKLGTGNLARAYAECAAAALAEARIARVSILARYRVHCPFDDQGTVYATAHRHQASVAAQSEAEGAVLTLEIPPARSAALVAALSEAGKGRIRIEELP